MEKNTTRLIRIWADLGDSSLKVIVQLPNHPPQKLMMGSRVVELDDFQIAQHQGSLLVKSYPQTDAWIRLGRQYYAVGQLAEKYAVDATRSSEQKQPKQMTAIPKLLAISGVIQELYDLPPQWELNLILLLPYPEYKFAIAPQNNLKAQLAKALSQFEFRGHRLRVKLRDLSCKPEGAGLIMLRYQEEGGADWLLQNKVVASMFGERNTSLIVYDHGSALGFTNNLGFYNLVVTVQTSSLGQSASDLTAVLLQLGKDLSIDNPLIQRLATTDKSQKRIELERLLEAMTSAKRHLWQQLSTWAKPLVEGASELIIAGGAAPVYLDDIEATFPSIPLYKAIALPSQQTIMPPFPSPPKPPEWDDAKAATYRRNWGDVEGEKRYRSWLAECDERQNLNYSQQLELMQATIAQGDAAPSAQLQKKANQMIDQLEKALFKSRESTELEPSDLTRFVDIYGIWKGTKHEQE